MISSREALQVTELNLSLPSWGICPNYKEPFFFRINQKMTNNEEEIFYSDEDISDSELYQVCSLSSSVSSNTDNGHRRGPRAQDIFLESLRAFSVASCGRLREGCVPTVWPAPCITRLIGLCCHSVL